MKNAESRAKNPEDIRRAAIIERIEASL